MARNQRKYNTEYKVQAVKLSNKIESSKAAVELDTGRYAVRMGQGGQRGAFGYRRRSAYTANRNESGRGIEYPAQAGKAAGEGNTAIKGGE